MAEIKVTLPDESTRVLSEGSTGADLATDILGVKVLVENKTGGGGTIGIGAVAKSKPDGYTIGFISTSPITIRPHFMKMPYKPMNDLTYLGKL